MEKCALILKLADYFATHIQAEGFVEHPPPPQDLWNGPELAHALAPSISARPIN